MRSTLRRIISHLFGLALATACLTPTPAATEPFLVAIEIHVEHSACPPDQRRLVERISGAAANRGIRVSFGFGRKFFRCTALGEQQAMVSRVLADGHAATLHADLEPGTHEQMLSSLVTQATQLRRLGGDPRVSSGVCTGCPGACEGSPSCPQVLGWVEAARNAGIQAVAGVVRYCYLSLDTMGRYGLLYRHTCADPDCAPRGGDPSTCHAHVPAKDRGRLAPWKTERTATWLRKDGAGLLIIPTFPDVPPHCFYEATQGATDPRMCSDSGAADGSRDGEALAALIREAARLRGRARTDAFHLVWSTNTLSDDAYVGAFFQALRGALDATGALQGSSREVVFVTLPQMVDAHR